MQGASITRAYVVLILCNLFGGLAVYAGWRDYCRAKATADWPSTAGEIVSAETVGGYTDSVKSYWVVRPVVSYAYNVGGQELIGDRLTFKPRQRRLERSEQAAQETIAQYKKGQQVRVFYSPDDPTQSVLEPGSADGLLVPSLIGLLIMGFATTFVVSAAGLELLPQPIRWWLRIRMAGKKSAAISNESKASSIAWASDIREKIFRWEPGVCVLLKNSQTSSMDLLFYSALIGTVLSLVSGSVVVFSSMSIDWLPGTVGVNVFAISTLLLFAISRFQDRRATTTIDWLSGTFEIRRDLAFRQRGSIHDIGQVLVRCQQPRKHVRRFYAVVELQLPTGNIVIAQNDRLRRKAEVASQHAAKLAKPLAEALDVPMVFVDDLESTRGSSTC